MKYFKFDENMDIVPATLEEVNQRTLPYTILPDDAKVAYKGKIFSVFEYPQKQYDGSTSIYEFVKRPDTMSVIPITLDNKFIYVKEHQAGLSPFVGMFGGRIEGGETIIEGALRELKEEAGLIADTFIRAFSMQLIPKTDCSSGAFFVKGLTQTEKKLDPGERIEVCYADFDEFFEAITSNQSREIETKLYLLNLFKNNQLERLKKSLLNFE